MCMMYVLQINLALCSKADLQGIFFSAQATAPWTWRTWTGVNRGLQFTGQLIALGYNKGIFLRKQFSEKSTLYIE